MPIYWVFRFFGGLLELFSTQVFMKNCVSLLYFLLRSVLRWKFSLPAAKKWKPKDSILPRWGEKNDRVCFPPKESFGKSKLVFMFKVGAKIDIWPFYVQSRSQNRRVTILNLYMGGKKGYSPFPPSTDASTHASPPASTDASTPASTPASTDVRVYAHLLNFFGNFKNSWKIYEPNKWKKCVSLLEFGAFLDFVAI